MFVDIFGIDPSNILFIGCGGGGYITKSTDGNNRNFVDAISAIPDNFKDADIITFLGGQNDAGNTSAQEQSAVTSAINAALSTLPYAQVHVFHTPFSFTALNTDKQNIKIGQEAALAGLYNPRVFSHGNMHRAGVLLDNLCGHQSGVHLNNAGYGMLKNIMGKAVIDGGNCIFPSYLKSFSIPDSNNNFSFSGGSYFEDNSGIGIISFLGQTKKDLAATYEFARLDTSVITASFYSVGYSVALDGTSSGSINLNQSSNLVCATTSKANSLINVKTAVMAGF